MKTSMTKPAVSRRLFCAGCRGPIILRVWRVKVPPNGSTFQVVGWEDVALCFFECWRRS